MERSCSCCCRCRSPEYESVGSLANKEDAESCGRKWSKLTPREKGAQCLNGSGRAAANLFGRPFHTLFVCAVRPYVEAQHKYEEEGCEAAGCRCLEVSVSEGCAVIPRMPIQFVLDAMACCDWLPRVCGGDERLDNADRSTAVEEFFNRGYAWKPHYLPDCNQMSKKENYCCLDP